MLVYDCVGLLFLQIRRCYAAIGRFDIASWNACSHFSASSFYLPVFFFLASGCVLDTFMLDHRRYTLGVVVVVSFISAPSK